MSSHVSVRQKFQILNLLVPAKSDNFRTLKPIQLNMQAKDQLNFLILFFTRRKG